ncbi:ricin-type beta-trefoil lectin domain protein [Thermomonospora umbrina]|uniref:Ricin-type beta-trefoil lectin protein n=1 Tax=Thermomonospora umbrina TaxID=111806 RepID=A0A3D9SGJ5_9ACTN|nr:ricin-type beta-trefoil lectin domain protein [Thermomonospora umbrina]REE95019.1 ricin-type beta-trefoil lectin protein [Thermomonospora umbrina]
MAADPGRSPAQVAAALTGAATTGLVTGAGSGSPNRLLHTGAGTTPPPASARYTSAGGRCLDASLATPGVVHAWDCHEGTNQQWTTGEDRTLRALGKCLDVQGNAAADGTPVILWDCHGGANQQWTQTGATLVSAATGKCLDAGVGANGTALVIRACNGSTGQNWTRS